MENSSLALKEEDQDQFEEFLQSLPKERELITGLTFCCYQGFWIPDMTIKPIISFQKHFEAFDEDLILASCPKSGTTWLKSLCFSIVNRHLFPLSQSPLITSNPHALVLNLEYDVYDKPENFNSTNDIKKPRLLCTHVPYSSLPISIKNSKCKIVYICRNPMDIFVSSCHFLENIFGENQNPLCPSREELFDQFYRGVHLFGPSWEHVVEFLKASLERPEKILFIKYEDLKKDIIFEMKKLAEFLGFPFSKEEEKEGIVEKIAEFCSIENMKTLKANIEGKRPSGALNKSYFRKGEVGDWKTHLTPLMVERIENLIQEKYEKVGLKFF